MNYDDIQCAKRNASEEKSEPLKRLEAGLRGLLEHAGLVDVEVSAEIIVICDEHIYDECDHDRYFHVIIDGSGNYGALRAEPGMDS